jgi:hypothetical protein
VLSNPDGATVQVDDQRPVVAPWTGELKPGRHHLSFTLVGYADAQRDVELNANEPLDVSVRLEQRSAAPTATRAGASSAVRGPRLGALPWVTLGVGAAALGGALTFELLRRSAENDARHETQVGYQSQLEREQGRQTAARIFLGAGAAFAVAGGVMLLFDSKPKSGVSSAGLICVPELCAASAIGRF